MIVEPFEADASVVVGFLTVVADDVGMLSGAVGVTTRSAASASSFHELLPFRVDVLLRRLRFLSETMNRPVRVGPLDVLVSRNEKRFQCVGISFVTGNTKVGV